MLLLWVGAYFFISNMIRGAAQAEIRVRAGVLMAKGGVYGRSIPFAAIKLAEARPVTLGKGTPEQLRWRTNGIGFSGLQAGWFRLGNGEKALVFVTDKKKAVYLPTTLGYSVVVSPENPSRFKV